MSFFAGITEKRTVETEKVPESAIESNEKKAEKESPIEEALDTRIDDIDTDLSTKSIVDDVGNAIEQSNDGLQPNATFLINGVEYTTDENGRIDSIDGVYVGDDNGKEYRDAEGNLLPNCTYTLDGIKYSTDDNGNIYMIDGQKKPNITYELNGNKYTTDDKGRIILCVSYPHRTPENARDNNAQKQAGGEDRLERDQGGHITSRDLGGDPGHGNLVSMDSRINQSDYKKMEGAIKNALDNVQEVTTTTVFTYTGDSTRPDTIEVEVLADGKKTTYIFDNNMDGSLIEKVPEAGKEVASEVVNETGGVVSSIVQEYDDNGNVVKSFLWVTYVGEDGKNFRRKVSISQE